MNNIKFYLICFLNIASLNLSGATDKITKTMDTDASWSFQPVSSDTSFTVVSQENGKKRKREDDEELENTETARKRKREKKDILKIPENGFSIHSAPQITFQLESNSRAEKMLETVRSGTIVAQSFNLYPDPFVEEMYLSKDVRDKIIDFYFDRILDLNVDIKAIPDFINLCFKGENQAIYQFAFIAQDLIEEENALHKQLITHIHIQAEEGSPAALYNLGAMYELGVGVKQDQQIALNFYEKAAYKNHAGACQALGAVYRKGCFGVEQDEKKALDWINMAAIYGNPLALFELGLMCHTGCGAPRDSTQAIVFYKQAADAGLAMAQGQLGYLYEQGKHLPQNYTKAMELYYKAAEQGDAQAQFRLAEIYHQGNSSIQVNYQKAEEYYRKAAEQGHVQAQLILESMTQDKSSEPPKYLTPDPTGYDHLSNLPAELKGRINHYLLEPKDTLNFTETNRSNYQASLEPDFSKAATLDWHKEFDLSQPQGKEKLISYRNCTPLLGPKTS